MKRLILLIAILCVSTMAFSQALQREKCKTKDVELRKYNGELADDAVIVGSPTMLLDREVSEISDLTEREIRKFKKWVRQKKSCTAYLDFDQLFIDQETNPQLTKKHLSCIVIMYREE